MDILFVIRLKNQKEARREAFMRAQTSLANLKMENKKLSEEYIRLQSNSKYLSKLIPDLVCVGSSKPSWSLTTSCTPPTTHRGPPCLHRRRNSTRRLEGEY